MLAYMGHVAVDARSMIVRACTTTLATGKAEVEAALEMIASCAKVGTRVAGDRFYDQNPFINGMKNLGMVPHPRSKSKNSQVDERTLKCNSYEESMKNRYKVEGVFAWLKSIAGMKQTKLRGLEKVDMDFTLANVARNIMIVAKQKPCAA